jgi:hypothetical protein
VEAIDLRDSIQGQVRWPASVPVARTTRSNGGQLQHPVRSSAPRAGLIEFSGRPARMRHHAAHHCAVPAHLFGLSAGPGTIVKSAVIRSESLGTHGLFPGIGPHRSSSGSQTCEGFGLQGCRKGFYVVERRKTFSAGIRGTTPGNGTPGVSRASGFRCGCLAHRPFDKNLCGSALPCLGTGFAGQGKDGGATGSQECG